jgi:hypothetical protein
LEFIGFKKAKHVHYLVGPGDVTIEYCMKLKVVYYQWTLEENANAARWKS